MFAEKRKPRNIGNTTVRNPYRLRDGLLALVDSKFHGNLSGKTNEQGFAQLLHDAGIVDVKRIQDGKEADDVGRKRRSALSQLGFIVHQNALEVDNIYADKLYTITANGSRLIGSDSIISIQECFLRALVAYQVPSVIESNKSYKSFKPLIHLLKIMQRLSEEVQSSLINQKEFGLFIQLTSSDDDIQLIVDAIKDFRKGKEESRNKKQFVGNAYEKMAENFSTVSADTLKDYSDSNLRYLKATGLFSTYGKGIKFNEDKILQINQIIEGCAEVIQDNKVYIQTLFNGAKLPTDDVEKAREAVEALQLKA